MSPANNGILSTTGPRGPEDTTVATNEANRLTNRPAPAPTLELQKSLADIKGQAQFLV